MTQILGSILYIVWCSGKLFVVVAVVVVLL